jgi:hypothetical protein
MRFHKYQPITSLRAKLESCDHILKGGEREGDHFLGQESTGSLQLLSQDMAQAYEFIREVLT